MPALRARVRIASLSRNARRRRLAHAGQPQILAQHRGQLDVEIVQRDDAVDLFGAGDMSDALADILRPHLTRDVVELVDRLAWPVGVPKLFVGQQKHAATLAIAFTNELVAFSVCGDAEDRQRHNG